MFKRFFEKMAGEASLTNIKFDLDNLRHSFPHSAPAASKYLFQLIENITLARANGMSSEDVTAAIQNKIDSFDPELKEIVTSIYKLVVASSSGDEERVAQLDAKINQLFLATVGSPIDISKMPLLSRIASANE